MLVKCMISFFLLVIASFTLANNEDLNKSTYKQPHIIRLGTKAHWEPYHLNVPDGADGIAVRSVACIMARINQPFVIEKKPWKRVQFETKNHKLDGFFAASKNDKRDVYAVQSEVFLPQIRNLYFLKSHHQLNTEKYTLDYIKSNFLIGARAGSNALHALEKKNYNVSLTPQTENQLLQALERNRVNAIIENSLVFDTLIKKTKRDPDDFHKVLFGKKNMGVYFGRHFLAKKPGFLAKFNRNIPPCSLLN